MRYTFAVNYLAGGGELYNLILLLGNVSVMTTEGYLWAFQARRAGEQSKRTGHSGASSRRSRDVSGKTVREVIGEVTAE
jgi:hypothetical protein